MWPQYNYSWFLENDFYSSRPITSTAVSTNSDDSLKRLCDLCALSLLIAFHMSAILYSVLMKWGREQAETTCVHSFSTLFLFVWGRWNIKFILSLSFLLVICLFLPRNKIQNIFSKNLDTALCIKFKLKCSLCI